MAITFCQVVREDGTTVMVASDKIVRIYDDEARRAVIVLSDGHEVTTNCQAPTALNARPACVAVAVNITTWLEQREKEQSKVESRVKPVLAGPGWGAT